MKEETLRNWQGFGLDVIAIGAVTSLAWARPEGFAVAAMSTIAFIVGGRASNRAARTGAMANAMSQHPPAYDK